MEVSIAKIETNKWRKKKYEREVVQQVHEVNKK